MKLIILLSLLAVATQQQLAVMPRRSWMMPFPYLQQPSHFHDQDYSDGIYDNSPFDPRGPVYILAGDEDTIPMKNDYMLNNNDQQRYVENEPRVKNYGQHQQLFNSGYQQPNNQRFVFGTIASGTHQPFTKTATFTITSTCTDLTVAFCIPRLNLLAAAPAAVPNCRRKREYSPDLLGQDDNSQFSVIHPSKVEMVYPTELPYATMKDDIQQQQVDIVSSKDENTKDTNESNKFSEKQFIRYGRFLNWHFITSVTKTTWSVVSSVFTSTYVPAVNLHCLPPGYIICPEAGK